MRLNSVQIAHGHVRIDFQEGGVCETLNFPLSDLPETGRIEWVRAQIAAYLAGHNLEPGAVVLFPTEPGLAETATELWGTLPPWATWSADQAEEWIEENVTDLASAKAALATIARAITMLRDLVIAR